MIINEFQHAQLINIARNLKHGRKIAVLKRDSEMVDIFQNALDNILDVVKIPGQEDLR